MGQLSNCGIWGAMEKRICLFLYATCVKLFSYVRAYALGIGIPKNERTETHGICSPVWERGIEIKGWGALDTLG